MTPAGWPQRSWGLGLLGGVAGWLVHRFLPPSNFYRLEPTAAELAGHIEQLFADRQGLQALSVASHRLGHPEAAARIADRITDWLKSPPHPAP